MVLKLSFACWDYDRTKALEDGRVRLEGIELTYLNYRVEETSVPCFAPEDEADSSPQIFQAAALSGIRCLRAQSIVVCPNPEPRTATVHCHSRLSLAVLQAPIHVHQRELGHQEAFRSQGETHWHS
jgi:hypothetical protein